MRYGFTTGSCAAAAAKAAAYMLLSGMEKTEITIETPKGIPYTAQITDIQRKECAVTCAVIKDGGDDPDVTTGSRIVARVTLPEEQPDSGEKWICGLCCTVFTLSSENPTASRKSSASTGTPSFRNSKNTFVPSTA